MTAADTNVLVHLLTGDDPAQAAQARRLFETEWVLRFTYGLPRTTIASAFGK